MKHLTNMLNSFTDADWFDLVVGDYDDQFKPVTEEEQTKSGRWNINIERVFKYLDEVDVYVRVYWTVGATEYQDVEPNYYFEFVKPVQKTITVYERI